METNNGLHTTHTDLSDRSLIVISLVVFSAGRRVFEFGQEATYAAGFGDVNEFVCGRPAHFLSLSLMSRFFWALVSGTFERRPGTVNSIRCVKVSALRDFPSIS